MKEEEYISRLSSKCRSCRYVKTCNHKQMEALAYLKPAACDVSLPLAQPLLRKKDLIDIHLDKHTTVTIDLEELKERGHFKGVMDTSMNTQIILENCEVIE